MGGGAPVVLIVEHGGHVIVDTVSLIVEIHVRVRIFLKFVSEHDLLPWLARWPCQPESAAERFGEGRILTGEPGLAGIVVSLHEGHELNQHLVLVFDACNRWRKMGGQQEKSGNAGRGVRRGVN